MHHALWQSVLGEIELSVSHATFMTWFKNTELIDNNDRDVVIAVPNIFAKRQFEVKFNNQIKEVLLKNGISAKQITYRVKSSGKKTVVNRETTTPTADELTQPTEASSTSRIASSLSTNGLNPRYTLDNFIVGSSNDLAYTASQAVAANPGTKYNPLFLYGGVGLGKTHLIQAVGNEIVKNQPTAKVLYISSETFVKEFLESIRFKKKGFSDKYRNIDVLIVDDMQFIAGKEKTQEEFFHTFNALHQTNKQIIISSDKPPKSIPTLTERLRSRLSGVWQLMSKCLILKHAVRFLKQKPLNRELNLLMKPLNILRTISKRTFVNSKERSINSLLTLRCVVLRQRSLQLKD